MTAPVKNLVSVISGIAVIAAVAALLFPLEQLMADKFFHIFGPANKTDDVIFVTSLVCWFFIPAFAGGLVTSLFTTSKPVIYSFITGISSFLVVTICIIITTEYSLEISPILFSLILVAGALAGGFTGRGIQRRKAARRESR